MKKVYLRIGRRRFCLNKGLESVGAVLSLGLMVFLAIYAFVSVMPQ